jgi:predicted ester cyclase
VARKAFADTPFSTEVFVCEPGGTAAVGTMDITSEDKYLVIAEGGDAVRRDAVSTYNLCVFHIVVF